MISNVNKVAFSSQNLTIETNKNNRQSIIRFNNHLKRKNSFVHRQVLFSYYCSNFFTVLFVFFYRKHHMEI
jgi:hypothetical protein